MESTSFQTMDGKIVLRLQDRVCDTPEELLSSEQFQRILNQFIKRFMSDVLKNILKPHPHSKKPRTAGARPIIRRSGNLG